MKVAYFSPLPPDRSGIADYSALLLPALERLVEVEAVRPGRTRPPAADVAVYHIGNNPDAHGWILDALRRRPGVVVLHDFVLHHLVAGTTIGRKDGHAYLAAMEREAGVPGRLLGFGVLEGRVPPLWEVRPAEFPLAGEVLDRATGLIVHSEYVAARAREAGYEGPIRVIPHPAWPVPRVVPAELGVSGFQPHSPVFGCFGHLNESKRIPQLLEAFARMRVRFPDARLLLVGPAAPGFDLDGRIERLGLAREGVVREDYVEEERLWSLMAACDACVLLRAPTMGETSGSAVRALSLGKPLVVSDVGWFAELPDAVALKVPVGGEEEVDALVAALGQLASDEHLRAEMSEAARTFAARSEVGRVAELYAAALEEAAGSHAVEASVLAEIALAAADTGLDAQLVAPQLAATGLVTNGHVRPIHVPAPGTGPRLFQTVPNGLWLAAIVVVSSVVQFVLGRRVVAPWIMVDELVYSDMARSFAATGHFLIRDAHANYGFVYPAILSLSYKLADTVPTAYGIAKAIDAPLASLAAVPAYFLARRVVRPATALVAAALAVALPSLVYAGTLMTENAFYPLFLCVALAVVAMLERPLWWRQVLVLALCALAFATRAQAVALVVAALSAPPLLAWIERGRPRRLAAYAPLYGLTALGALAVIVAELVRGRSPSAALGNYSVTGSGGYQAWPAFKWVLFHVAELDLALWILPFAALIVLVANARHLDARLRVFAAASVSLSVWLILEVALFASRYSQRIEERNLYYLMPLFLIALLAWIERGQPKPPRATVAAAVAAAALPGVLPFATLLNGVNSESDTLGLRPWWYLQNALVGESSVPLVAILVSAALAAAFLWLPRRHAPWLPALVAAGFLAVWLPLELWDYSFPKASLGALYQGINTGVDRDWIDAAAGRDANVAALWTNPSSDYFQVWENEFFNRSVRRVYDLGPSLPGEMPERKTAVDAASGTLTSAGKPIDADYVVVDSSTQLVGQTVAHVDTPNGRLNLVHVAQPARLTTRILSWNPKDHWSGPTLEWIRSGCRGGSLSVTVTSDPTLFPHGQQIVASGGAGKLVFRLAPKQTRILTVPIAGPCRVAFGVTPHRVPADYIEGNHDTRDLGARFSGFAYRPPK